MPKGRRHQRHAQLQLAIAARRAISDRLISEISTAGASIKLEERSDSYFDQYLDGIVSFFSTTEPDIVVFEDLDRFDDDRIFDSLRELNNLINESPYRARWTERIARGKRLRRPVRFVYAIKDSLFEQLGDPADTAGGSDTDDRPGEQGGKTRRDPAKAAVERANRTKFFEVVVPVVPFLTHSNARDLLNTELAALRMPEELPGEEGVDGARARAAISRALIDVVARHTTDMRLMLNIRNEFVVFAERLLWVAREKRAPGMTADDLFAMVTYKNFHLGDFEKLPQRDSALDRLETTRREFVAREINDLQKTRRRLIQENRHQREQDELAKVLGERLQTIGTAVPRQTSSGPQAVSTGGLQEAVAPSFWRNVAISGELTVLVRGNQQQRLTLDRDELTTVFPEAMEAARWDEPDDEWLAVEREKIDRRVAELRGAGFAELAQMTPPDGHESFGQAIDGALESQLARDLVRSGYLDRYYAEHTSTFYGSYLGVDVANFFRNCVWPNVMDVNFRFTTRGAEANVLQEAPTGFARSRSALNIQIVDHMLTHDRDQARELVAFLVAEQTDHASAFLDAFLNDSRSNNEELVALLAEHPWPALFSHLNRDDSVQDQETRTRLIDAALLAGSAPGDYDADSSDLEPIMERYAQLTAFTQPQSHDRSQIILEFIRAARFDVPHLEPLGDKLLELVVTDGAYRLSADNLRKALNRGPVESIGLEDVRANDPVWQRCKEDIDGYLNVLRQDNSTPAVREPGTLRDIITEQHEAWSAQQLTAVLGCAAREAQLPEIDTVPSATWRELSAAQLVMPTAANILTYSEEHGVDEPLTKLLIEEPGVPVALERIDDLSAEDRHLLLVRILNAGQVLRASERISIATQLYPDPDSPVVEANELKPKADDSLAGLLEAGLIEDTAKTFEHFIPAGWSAVEEAFAVSSTATEFLTPELVAPVVGDLLISTRVPNSVKQVVVDGLATYIPAENEEALQAAARHAHRKNIKLPIDALQRIAPAVTDEPDLVLRHLANDQGIGGEQLIGVLKALGGDWAGFGQPSGHEFDVPRSDLVMKVLKRIEGAGLIELPNRRTRGRKKVKIR